MAVQPRLFALANRGVRLFSPAALLLVTTVLASAANGAVPKYDHVLVVILENHSFEQIQAAADAPYLHELAAGGALFVKSFAVSHPSEPNYFALFSGSTQGVQDDRDHDFARPNLASGMVEAHKSFVGYVESGSPRKHNPWESFADAAAYEEPLSSFPADFTKLPSVSFVIPNLWNDMHDGTINQGDAWLRAHLANYAEWSKSNNSLLIVTFDDDDNSADNHILTIFYGSRIKPGHYAENIDHYTVLRTIESIDGIPPLGLSAGKAAIADIWAARTIRRKR